MKYTNEEILKGIRQNKRVVINYFFAECKVDMENQVIRRYGCSPQIAEEAFSQAFMILIKFIQQGKDLLRPGETSLKNYLWVIFRRTSAASMRKEPKLEGLDTREPNLIAAAPVESGWDLVEFTRVALKGLDEKCRRLLRQLFFGKELIQDLAGQLGVDRKTIARRRDKCILKLRMQFGNLGINGMEDI